MKQSRLFGSLLVLLFCCITFSVPLVAEGFQPDDQDHYSQMDQGQDCNIAYVVGNPLTLHTPTYFLLRVEDELVGYDFPQDTDACYNPHVKVVEYSGNSPPSI